MMCFFLLLLCDKTHYILLVKSRHVYQKFFFREKVDNLQISNAMKILPSMVQNLNDIFNLKLIQVLKLVQQQIFLGKTINIQL